jgi:hypothetical protein
MVVQKGLLQLLVADARRLIDIFEISIAYSKMALYSVTQLHTDGMNAILCASRLLSVNNARV